MTVKREDIEKHFDETIEKITKDLRHLMSRLWENWSHLGVDEKTKFANIVKLHQIEHDFHNEVMTETTLKMKWLQEQIESLKEETEELSRSLSINIELQSMTEDTLLYQYKKDLEDQIAGYREQVKQRTIKMERLLEWQQDLSEKLGVTMQQLQEIPLPSEEELDQLKHNLEVLQAERDRRVESFLYTQVEIKNIMEKLQMKPQSKFEQMVVSSLSVDFKVTDMNMDRLAKLQQDLQEKYEQTNNRVLELRERLARLWECLEEDQIYRDNFLQAHPGCSPPTEAALKEELKRCEVIKRQKISVFVANIRTKIKLMWDNLMYSREQRDEFQHYHVDHYTEDILALHEMYLEKITKFYEEHRDIYELVATRKGLWQKMTELEARASAPGRFNNRGGQLLKEERERKAIASSLPNVEAQIREKVLKYEEETGVTFTIDGKPLLVLMKDDWENRKAERQNKMSARKQALTPTTPSFRSMATSPLGKRNRTAAGLAHTADRNRPPTKRQLVTGSATKATSISTANRSVLKRSAITSIKRRMSGRLAARDEGKSEAKRKLDYLEPHTKNTKIIVNGSILKHKRTSLSRRRSNRQSVNVTQTTSGDEQPLAESTMLTTYTDFRDGIHLKQISRSSVAHNAQHNVDNIVSIKVETPKTALRNAAQTPRGKENTPNPSNLLVTPNRLTRSATKLNLDGFATPRTPLSSKNNVVKNMQLKTTPNSVGRSKSQTHLVRVKNLPPLI
ncbi:protein regulator of cytokinesis 1-like isoform X1 [Pieris napi]|uniref:protein regulator of cytokinesis 1-like isoform X1 n=1 Tax=Pieris napi TaxID=78633 RepID=UPI001FB9AD03|nr:protein regulator of cytokinesis 1-like isoform X1 [Pieris napi]